MLYSSMISFTFKSKLITNKLTIHAITASIMLLLPFSIPHLRNKQVEVCMQPEKLLPDPCFLGSCDFRVVYSWIYPDNQGSLGTCSTDRKINLRDLWHLSTNGIYPKCF